MATEQCLVIIKPDGLVKSLTGNIITTLSETKLKIVGAKVLKVPRKLAEEHYAHLKQTNPEVYEEILNYITGKYHTNRVLALIYHGEDAIKKVRQLCGSTNPEEADFISIRGKYGRVNSKTKVMENVIHASDSPESAEKEIKLWFKPDEVVELIYPVTTEKSETDKIIWK